MKRNGGIETARKVIEPIPVIDDGAPLKHLVLLVPRIREHPIPVIDDGAPLKQDLALQLVVELDADPRHR
mgnify:CR=1 FL=1